jgi:membrane-bound lytic murein transglycosylase D
MKKTISFLMLFVFLGVYAQKPNKQLNTDKATNAQKANFRVQVFEKKDSSSIKLLKPDPEFKNRLPIGAKIGEVSNFQDLPKSCCYRFGLENRAAEFRSF